MTWDFGLFPFLIFELFRALPDCWKMRRSLLAQHDLVYPWKGLRTWDERRPRFHFPEKKASLHGIEFLEYPPIHIRSKPGHGAFFSILKGSLRVFAKERDYAWVSWQFLYEAPMIFTQIDFAYSFGKTSIDEIFYWVSFPVWHLCYIKPSNQCFFWSNIQAYGCLEKLEILFTTSGQFWYH